MENVSKALLISASVLIGLLIISLGVYLFISFGATSNELHEQNYEKQINQFNSQFTKYEKKDEITIYDVISVTNLATENNIKYGFKKRNVGDNKGEDNYITVILDNKSLEFIEEESSNNLIANDLEKRQNYNCQVRISPTTQKVYKIIFTKK